MTRIYWAMLGAFTAGVITLILGYAIYSSFFKQESTNRIVLATPSTTVKKEATIPVQVAAPIQVYKPAVKKKLKLSESVIADTNIHVVASNTVKPDDRPRTLNTVIDTDTGYFTTYETIESRPWLAVNTHTHIAAYYGLKNKEQIVRIQAQQEILQTKALHIEAIASVDIGLGKPDTFIGIGGRFKF